MRFRLLGPVEAHVEGRQVRLGGPTPRTLLSVLVLARGKAVTDDQLIDAAWGEDTPASSRDVLQSHMSRLRVHLRNGSSPAASDPQLVRAGNGYALYAPPGAVDVHDFRTLCAAGFQPHRQPHHRSDLLRDALAQWRGPALTGTRDTQWVQAETAALDSLRLAALEARIEADLALGRHREVVAELEGLTIHQPFHERFHAQLMLALYRSGRQIDALGAYQRVRSQLMDEHGIEPDEDLQVLQRRVLSADPSLRWNGNAERSGARR